MISKYPKKTSYVKSLLTVKHGKLQSKLAARIHHKFWRDGIEGSHVKKFCHKIKRMSLKLMNRDISDVW